MKVSVTKQDIADAAPPLSIESPVTFAVRRATGDAKAYAFSTLLPRGERVPGERIRYSRVHVAHTSGGYFRLPPEVAEFENRRDKRLPVEPFEFELGEPELNRYFGI